jgi:hypothetical protein
VAVTSQHNIVQLAKVGRSIAYGEPDGKRFQTEPAKFANAAYALRIDVDESVRICGAAIAYTRFHDTGNIFFLKGLHSLGLIVAALSTDNGAQRMTEV